MRVEIIKVGQMLGMRMLMYWIWGERERMELRLFVRFLFEYLEMEDIWWYRFRGREVGEDQEISLKYVEFETFFRY